MHSRVESFPQPDPDYRRFIDAVNRGKPDRVPLVELAVHPEVVDSLLGEKAMADIGEITRRNIRLLHRLGYDVVKVSAPIPFPTQTVTGQDASELSSSARQWQDQHQGPIQNLEDFEKANWPDMSLVNFAPLEVAAEVLPEGMKAIGFSGGVLEFTMDMIGLEKFMFAVYDQPELVQKVVNRVGRIIYDVFESYCQMDHVCALWLGDDMGSKNGMLVSPSLLNSLIFPWYKKFVELAHNYDCPFILHSCGKIDAVYPTLIREVGIDAKHSFEDGILPVEEFHKQWGSEVGVLGGIDVNTLSVGSEEEITSRVRTVLQATADKGGYVCGSGNSIPNYVPPDNFLAMIEEVARFNGRM